MMPDMQADGERLGRIWDAWQAGRPPATGDDAELLAVIRDLESAMQVPAPPAELISRTWEQIAGAPLPLAPYATGGLPAITANGHRRPAPAAPVTSRARGIAVLAAFWRLAVIGVLAGFGAGFVVGLWTRVAMRLSGFLTVDANRDLLTENDEVVGRITLGGTLSLALFGAALGVMGGLLYLALRRWLPGRSWQRSLGYGVLLLAVFGFFIMDPANPDYVLFGPAWMNVGTFSLAYVLFGLLAGTLAELLDRRLPRLEGVAQRWKRVLLLVTTAPLILIALMALLTMVVGLLGTSALIVVVLLVALAAAAAGPRLIRAFSLRLPAPGRRFWYAAAAVPGLAGFVVTVRNIVEILQG